MNNDRQLIEAVGPIITQINEFYTYKGPID